MGMLWKYLSGRLMEQGTFTGLAILGALFTAVGGPSPEWAAEWVIMAAGVIKAALPDRVRRHDPH